MELKAFVPFSSFFVEVKAGAAGASDSPLPVMSLLVSGYDSPSEDEADSEKGTPRVSRPPPARIVLFNH